MISSEREKKSKDSTMLTSTDEHKIKVLLRIKKQTLTDETSAFILSLQLIYRNRTFPYQTYLFEF